MPKIKGKMPDIGVAQTPVQTTINETVAVRSLFPAHLKYIGKVSGKVYEWRQAGATVPVDKDDVPYLLEKVIGGRSCCGVSSDGNKVFEAL